MWELTDDLRTTIVEEISIWRLEVNLKRSSCSMFTMHNIIKTFTTHGRLAALFGRGRNSTGKRLQHTIVWVISQAESRCNSVRSNNPSMSEQYEMQLKMSLRTPKPFWESCGRVRNDEREKACVYFYLKWLSYCFRWVCNLRWVLCKTM